MAISRSAKDLFCTIISVVPEPLVTEPTIGPEPWAVTWIAASSGAAGRVNVTSSIAVTLPRSSTVTFGTLKVPSKARLVVVLLPNTPPSISAGSWQTRSQEAPSLL